MRLQQMSEAVPAKIRICQAVWQRVPEWRAGHREGPRTECAEPASWNHRKRFTLVVKSYIIVGPACNLALATA